MKKTLMTTFGQVLLLQILLISNATCQPLPQDKSILSDPRLIDQIVRKTAPMNYSLVVDSRKISEAKQEDEVRWLKRRPVLGGMVIGMISGFTVGFVQCVGEHDLTVAGAMIICGGYGAGIGAGIGALVGKVISER